MKGGIIIISISEAIFLSRSSILLMKCYYSSHRVAA